MLTVDYERLGLEAGHPIGSGPKPFQLGFQFTDPSGLRSDGLQFGFETGHPSGLGVHCGQIGSEALDSGAAGLRLSPCRFEIGCQRSNRRFQFVDAACFGFKTRDLAFEFRNPPGHALKRDKFGVVRGRPFGVGPYPFQFGLQVRHPRRLAG